MNSALKGIVAGVMMAGISNSVDILRLLDAEGVLKNSRKEM